VLPGQPDEDEKVQDEQRSGAACEPNDAQHEDEVELILEDEARTQDFHASEMTETAPKGRGYESKEEWAAPTSVTLRLCEVASAIILYSPAAVGTPIVNKLCMREAHLPSFFAILQFAFATASVVLLSAVDRCIRDDITLRWSRVWPYLVYSCIFVATVYSYMQALDETSIATVIIFRTAVPLMVSVLDWTFLGRQLPSKRSLQVLVCVAGSLLGYMAFDHAKNLHGLRAYTVLGAHV
jgi:uncharacterized membrane protein